MLVQYDFIVDGSHWYGQKSHHLNNNTFINKMYTHSSTEDAYSLNDYSKNQYRGTICYFFSSYDFYGKHLIG